MAHIFVSGGGDLQVSHSFDLHFLQSLSGKRIGYIPRAMPNFRYQSCLERIDGLLPQQEGFEVVVLDEDVDYAHDQHTINQLDGIYIGGGNTYRLMSICRDNNFFEYLHTYLLSNKPVYGGSAGAILLGQSIHSSPDANITNLSTEQAQGLNQFDQLSFFCHYTTKNDWEILEYVQYHHTPVVALPEGTGLIQSDGKIIVQGQSSAYLFTYGAEKREVKLGKILLSQ